MGVELPQGDNGSSDSSVILPTTATNNNTNTHIAGCGQLFDSDRLGSTRSLRAANQAAFVRIITRNITLFHFILNLLYFNLFTIMIYVCLFLLLLVRYEATMRKLQCHEKNALRSK